jgi:hypothetical protein
MSTPNHAAHTECRPGERIVAGKVYVFNAELLNDHVAAEAVANAPTDLSGLDERALGTLLYACLRCWALNKGAEGPWTELSLRVQAERRARDQKAAA